MMHPFKEPGELPSCKLWEKGNAAANQKFVTSVYLNSLRRIAAGKFERTTTITNES